MTSPKAQSAVRGREFDDRDSGHPQAGRARRVLLIDDDEGTLLTWRLMLAHEGFDVELASSGTDGLARARRAAHDVIVLDLRLPDMDGLTVLAALREQAGDTPILIVTGFATHDSTARAFRLGAADVLEKPIGDELVATVRDLAVRTSPRRSSSSGDARDLRALLGTLRQSAQAIARGTRGGAPSGASPSGASQSGASPGETSSGDASPGDTSAGEAATDAGSGLFLAALVRAFTRPDLRVQALPACAAALREAVEASDELALPRCAERLADDVALACTADGATVPPSVATALARLEVAIHAGQHPIHESKMARDLALHPTHLGRLLKLHLGLGFRQIRRLFRARRALLLVVDSDEQLAQIAYAVGYPHPSQLDRDFRTLFGARPGALRRRVRPRFSTWRTSHDDGTNR